MYEANQQMDRQKLTEVARGALYPDTASDLFRATLRLGASLTILLFVEQEVAMVAGVVNAALFEATGSSVAILNLFTGFGGIEKHLTEEFALANEIREKTKANHRREKKRARIEYEGERTDTMTVELNQEILVKVGDGRSVRARVTKVEATAEGEGDTTILPGQRLINLQVAI
jgi:hypothetical protein